MIRRGEIVLGDKRGYRRLSGRFRRRVFRAAAVILVLIYLSWAVAEMKTRTQIKQALLDISRIEHATRLFRADQGRCPEDMAELLSPVGDRRYFAPEVDPWGHPYRLQCPAILDPGGVSVSSGGPDGDFGGEDNISSL
ncbi:MAG: type II secretion system protein GspG [Myxococcota bacterium]|nr:type II secretion system protein GspG [Myxococcota bacterium]